MPHTIIREILADAWGTRALERGAMILLCTAAGRVLYQDSRFEQALGHPLEANAFDSIPADLAAQAGSMVAANVGIDIESEFPLLDSAGKSRWMRFEVHWVRGVIAMAVWPLVGDHPRKVVSRPLD